MSGFTDSIVGGVGSLIRQYIKSPNYVPGVSGWSINKDGSAEFSNAIIRGTVIISGSGEELLVYSGPPATGNLIFAISSVVGTDPYGNNYYPGVTMPAQTASQTITMPSVSHPSANHALFGLLDQTANITALNMQGPGNANGTDFATVQLEYDYGLNTSYAYIESDDINLVFNRLAAGSGLRVGGGPTGKYYSEENQFTTTQSIPNNALTNLNIGAQIQGYNDYAGSAFGASTWTCPESGPYDIGFGIDINGTWSGQRFLMQITGSSGKTYIRDDRAAATRPIITKGCTRYIAQGDVLSAALLQASGAVQTLNIPNSFWSMARHL